MAPVHRWGAAWACVGVALAAWATVGLADAASPTCSALTNEVTTQTVASSGVIGVGDEASPYAAAQSCEWRIYEDGGDGAEALNVYFTAFDLAPGDEVSVRAGFGIAATELGPFNASYPPGTSPLQSLRTGDGQPAYLVITFTSAAGSPGTHAGFSAVYTDGGCQAPAGAGPLSLREDFGSFSDGSGAQNYFSSMACVWVIEPTPQPPAIHLSFGPFDVNTKDTITVYSRDRATGQTYLIGTTTGDSPTPFSSFSGSMEVHFDTTSSATGKVGFHAGYWSEGTDAQGNARHCPPTTTFSGAADSAAITDGSGPGSDYGPGFECTWHLLSGAGYEVLDLTFPTFDLALTDELRVAVRAAVLDQPAVTVYRGGDVPKPVHIEGTGSLIDLTFVSAPDSPGGHDGFTAEFHDGPCSGTQWINNTQARITDGSGSGVTRSNSDCYWLIAPRVAGGSVDRIWFAMGSYALEKNYDYVKVYDVEPTHGVETLMKTYTGSADGGSWTIDVPGDHRLKVYFHTDGGHNLQGFDANFWTAGAGVPCPSELAFTGGGGAGLSLGSSTVGLYTRPLNCSWSVTVGAPDSELSHTVSTWFNYIDLAAGDYIDVSWTSIDASGSAVAPVTRRLTGASDTGASARRAFEVAGLEVSLSVRFVAAEGAAAGGRGFDGGFLSSDAYCDGTISMGGELAEIRTQAPGVAEYLDNVRCTWAVQMPEGASELFFQPSVVAIDNNGEDLTASVVYANDTLKRIGEWIGGYSTSTESSAPANSVSAVADAGVVTGLQVYFYSDGDGGAAGLVGQIWAVGPQLACPAVLPLAGSASNGIGVGHPTDGAYSPGLDCLWHIRSNALATYVSVWIEWVSLAAGDWVELRVRSTTGAFVAWTERITGDGSTAPQLDWMIDGSDVEVDVAFHSEADSAGGRGFRGGYWSDLGYCSGDMRLPASFGRLSSNPQTRGYANNRACGWLLAPVGARRVAMMVERAGVDTNEWILANSYDEHGVLAPLASYGKIVSAPAGTVVSETGSMYVTFTSDGDGPSTLSSGVWGVDAVYWGVGPTIDCPALPGLVLLGGSSDALGVGDKVDGAYSAGQTCAWTIVGDAATHQFVSVWLEWLDLAPNDAVHITAVASDGGFEPFSATFTGTSSGLPAGADPRWSGNGVTVGGVGIRVNVTFESAADSPGGRGFSAGYSASVGYCGRHTDVSGVWGGIASSSGTDAWDTRCVWDMDAASTSSSYVVFAPTLIVVDANDEYLDISKVNLDSPDASTAALVLERRYVDDWSANARQLTVGKRVRVDLQSDTDDYLQLGIRGQWWAVGPTTACPAYVDLTNTRGGNGVIALGDKSSGAYAAGLNCTWHTAARSDDTTEHTAVVWFEWASLAEGDYIEVRASSSGGSFDAWTARLDAAALADVKTARMSYRATGVGVSMDVAFHSQADSPGSRGFSGGYYGYGGCVDVGCQYNGGCLQGASSQYPPAFLTGPYGSFGDGSGPSEAYLTKINSCAFMVAAPAASGVNSVSVRLTVDARSSDGVTLSSVDPATGAETSLGSLTGSSAATTPQTFTSPTGLLKVYWSAGTSNQVGGFDAVYWTGADVAITYPPAGAVVLPQFTLDFSVAALDVDACTATATVDGHEVAPPFVPVVGANTHFLDVWELGPHTVRLQLQCALDAASTIPAVTFADQSVDIVVGFGEEAAVEVLGGGFLNVTAGEVTMGAA